MDYKLLLAKYMVHLCIVEGSTFLNYFDWNLFTDAEIKELEAIDKHRNAIVDAAQDIAGKPHIIY